MEMAKLSAQRLAISKNEHRNVVASEEIITIRCLKSPRNASAVKYGRRWNINLDKTYKNFYLL